MTPSTPRSQPSPQSLSEVKLERLRELRELRQQQRAAKTAALVAAESDEFGELLNEVVGGRSYERVDKDGRLISSLVYDSPDGRLVYRLVGLSFADLI